MKRIKFGYSGGGLETTTICPKRKICIFLLNYLPAWLLCYACSQQALLHPGGPASWQSSYSLSETKAALIQVGELEWVATGRVFQYTAIQHSH